MGQPGELFARSLNGYQPCRPDHFHPRRIVLARGSDKPGYAELVDGICALYRDAEIIRAHDVPHNRIDLGTNNLREAHYRGKQTLVLAEHKSAVRFSSEDGNTCPNYWHFSPYGFCPFDCSYCYLAGTPGVRFSPTVKVFLNLQEMLDAVDRAARKAGQPTAFYLGKLQDGLALDPLTGYSRQLVNFFAEHPFARMTLLTKSTHVENLLGLNHEGHTILSWSLSPVEMVSRFERRTPPVGARMKAMRRCAEAGYPVRAVVMPIIPVDDWPRHYHDFLEQLLTTVPLQRITFGGICSYTSARALMEAKIGERNDISRILNRNESRCPDGRDRFPVSLRIEMYKHLIEVVRGHFSQLDIALCLEEAEVFHRLGLTSALGKCNCVL